MAIRPINILVINEDGTLQLSDNDNEVPSNKTIIVAISKVFLSLK